MPLHDPLPPAYDEIRRFSVEGVAPCDIDGVIAEVRRDMGDRTKELAHWAATYETPVPVRLARKYNPTTIPVEFALTLLFGGLGGIYASVWIALCIVVVGVAVLVFTAVRGGGRRKLRQVHEDRSCPECDYDLHGIVIAKDRRLAELLATTGPVLCPECGKEWPLVPRLAGGVASNSIKIDWPPRPDGGAGT